MRINPIAFLFYLSITFCNAQGIFKKTVSSIETGFILSKADRSNFAFRSLQYGEIPFRSNVMLIRLNHHKEYDTLQLYSKKYKNFNYAYGFRTAINIQNSLIFKQSEAYLKFRFKTFEFYGGRRREIFGLVDSTLSSGSYIWSGNALPLPKIQVHTPTFSPLFGSKKLFYLAGISHGWFGKEAYVQNHFLHQKWLYGKISLPKVAISLGLNHQTMWGGYSEQLKKITGPYPPTLNGYLAPYPLYSYQFVLFPFLQKIKGPDPSKVPGYDGGLAVGNQLGSIDLAIQWKRGRHQFLFYKQQPYDFARSVKNLNNIQDGNHGISWYVPNFKALKHVNFEFLDTRSQGLTLFGKNTSSSNFGESDNYFFHGQYQNWAYKNQILGTPYITSRNLDSNAISNNRIKLFHIAFMGEISKIKYALGLNFSENLGTYGNSENYAFFNSTLSLTKALKRNSILETALAYDTHELFSKGFGLKVNYKYYFYTLF